MNCGECEHIYLNKYNNYACTKLGGPVINLDTPACMDNFEVKNNDAP